MKEITDLLFSKQDKQYRAFQAPLIHNIDKNLMIGVRTPELKKIAKEIGDTSLCKSFIETLSHRYFEENQLHAFIISNIKDYQSCLKEVKRFLPYIDNWATCDQLCPKVFSKHKEELINEIKEWLKSDHLYTKRFAIKMLMSFYLDDSFNKEHLELVSNVKSDEYYLNMMVAWYFATALAKQYDSAIKYLEDKKLSPWVHNKTIQKALESYRINDEQKSYLISLKLKSK
jgi:3-methyladenine DNA glycosylase AlkD